MQHLCKLLIDSQTWVSCNIPQFIRKIILHVNTVWHLMHISEMLFKLIENKTKQNISMSCLCFKVSENQLWVSVYPIIIPIYLSIWLPIHVTITLLFNWIQEFLDNEWSFLAWNYRCLFNGSDVVYLQNFIICFR